MSFLLILTFLVPIAAPRIVEISLGRIEGRLFRTAPTLFGNQTGIVFLGIPYGKPPVGELRFRDAVPIRDRWTGIRKTKKFQSSCYGDPEKAGGKMSEDCLYLNVFTNDFCLLRRNCSVLVSIHGGMMVSHSPASFDSSAIIDSFVGNRRNVIVVSVAYRLGLYGFAHLNGEHGTSADSNIGITDVLEAMRFVNREIEHFGGDRRKIAVHGHSSGAEILTIMSLSPLSTGLYQKQLIMSAGSLLLTRNASSKGTRLVAIRIGCLSETDGFHFSERQVRDVFECLRNKSGEELFEVYLKVSQNEPVEFGYAWIDGKVINGELEQLLESPEYEKRSTIIGTTANEIGLSLYSQHRDGHPKIEEIRELCTVIAFEYGYERPLKLVDKCVEYYSAGPRGPSHVVDDLNFFLPSCGIAEALAAAGQDVFVYSFAYQSEIGHRFDYEQNPRHGDDQIYVFRKTTAQFRPIDFRIQHFFTGMLAAFVNDGTPSVSIEWHPFSLSKKEFLLIDFDANFSFPGMKYGYYAELTDFWRGTAATFGGKHGQIGAYPPSFDVPQVEFFANAKRSLLFNETSQKTLSARKRAYEEISEFVKEMKAAYQQKNNCGSLTIGAFPVVLLLIMFQ